MLPIVIDITTMYLLKILAIFFGDKEKDLPKLILIRIHDFKNSVSGIKKKARCQVVEYKKLFMKHVDTEVVLSCS